MNGVKLLIITLLSILTVSFLSFNTFNHAPTSSTKVNWITFEEAVQKNKENPKKVIVDIYTDWCFWCKQMDKATFQHPEIAEYINENFYAVKLDAQMKDNLEFKDNEYFFDQSLGGFHEIAFYLTRGRLSFPSVVFMDELMNNPQPVAGFQRPVDMDKLLKFFGDNYYKNMDWYQFNLKYPEIEGRIGQTQPSVNKHNR